MRTLRRLSHYDRKSSIVVGRQMEKAEEYRARATECDYRAEAANDAMIRTDFRDMARQWRQMADQIEQLEFERRS